jgi:hypothetical protein
MRQSDFRGQFVIPAYVGMTKKMYCLMGSKNGNEQDEQG